MSNFLTIAKEMALIRAAEAARPVVACPFDGTPLERARNMLHCPMGDYTVPSNTTQGDAS